MSRLTVVRFPHGGGELRNGKDAPNEACHNSGILRFCRTWPPAACEDGREGSSRLRHYDYFIPFVISLRGAISFAYRVSFTLQPRATHSTNDKDGNDDEDALAPSDIPL